MNDPLIMSQSLPADTPFLSALVRFLIRWRSLSLAIVALLTVLIWPLADRLEFDQAIESLYSEGDPYFDAYARSKLLFGGDEFAIVAWHETGLLNAETSQVSEKSRERITALADKLAQVPGVYAESIQQLADSSDVPGQIGLALDSLGLPPVLQRLAEKLDFSEEQARSVEMLEGVLIGADKETTAIVVRLMPEAESPVPRGQTVATIRELADAHDPPAFVVGEPVQIHDMFRYVEEDGRVLFQVSLILLAVVLLFLFGSLRWVALPLLLVVLAIRWTEGILVLSGAKLSMVSSMLNSLVTIIGVATVAHLAVGYRDRRRTLSPLDALASTLTDLLPAIFWTCATTAIGFGALLSSEITPVRSFGLMMSLATFLVFVCVLFVAPGGMCRWSSRADHDSGDESTPQSWRSRLMNRLNGDPIAAPAEETLVNVLTGVSRFVERRPNTVTLLALAIVGFSTAGLFRLRVETDFSRNFRDDSELVQSLNFFESNLGGAGTWEVNFPAPAKLDAEYLERVENLAQTLRDELTVSSQQIADGSSAEGRLTKVVSLTDGLEMLPAQVGYGFLSKKFSIEERLQMLSSMQPEFLASLYNAKQLRMRIVLRGLERQTSDRKLELIASVHQVATRSFAEASVVPGEVAGEDVASDDTANASEPAVSNAAPSRESDAPDDVSTTGIFVLLTFLIESLLRDQMVSFVIAAVGIGSMMAIAFRSVMIGFISMIPNLFPIVLVIGSMGWIGLPINIATAMIASVSMGLTVDSSVHYLSAWQRARRNGATVDEAIQQTQTSVGRALVYANVALVTGFSVLTLSHFIPLVYFGMLVSAAMLGGLAGNLFLLPLLLRKVSRDMR